VAIAGQMPLSHEYIHYIVVQLSHNRAPIWLHEGIAKYFESAWRLPSGGLAGPSLGEPARPLPSGTTALWALKIWTRPW
jgi:hypothetical protein